MIDCIQCQGLSAWNSKEWKQFLMLNFALPKHQLCLSINSIHIWPQNRSECLSHKGIWKSKHIPKYPHLQQLVHGRQRILVATVVDGTSLLMASEPSTTTKIHLLIMLYQLYYWKSSDYSRIFSNDFHYLLFPKLYQYNRCMPNLA